MVGAGSYFVLSLCDRLWRPDMSEAEALELMEKVCASHNFAGPIKLLMVACRQYNVHVLCKGYGSAATLTALLVLWHAGHR